MPDWTAFWAVAGLVLFLVLGLAWITSAAYGTRRAQLKHAERAGARDDVPPERASSGVAADDAAEQADPHDPAAGVAEPSPGIETGAETEARPEIDPSSEGEHAAVDEPALGGDGTDSIDSAASRTSDAGDVRSIPTAALLANVLLTHGGLGLLLLGAAALTGVPAAALGVEGTAWSTGLIALGGGLVVGAGLAAANVGLAASLDRVGIDHNEDLRTALAPDSATGWVVLLVVVLPLVAGFEELFFRAILIGGAAAATGLSPWPFVVLSTVAFALGHGLQGKGGIAVTGLLGGALGVAFVLTNSLLLVVIAHYVVNAVEFLLKEWLAVDLGSTD